MQKNCQNTIFGSSRISFHFFNSIFQGSRISFRFLNFYQECYYILSKISGSNISFSYTLPNKHLIGLTFNKKMNMFVSMTALKSIFFYMLLKKKKIRRFFGWCAQFLVMVHTVPKKGPINMKNKNFPRLISKRDFLKSFFLHCNKTQTEDLNIVFQNLKSL